MVVLSTWFCKPPLGLVLFGLFGLIDLVIWLFGYLVIWLFGFGFGYLVCVSVEINPLAWDMQFVKRPMHT